MSKHPSLDSPFLMPDMLEPRERMPVNDPCWCGSGLKWKKCHRDREKQQPVPIGKQLDERRQEMTKGYCLHPDASAPNCSAGVIKAHTVQRNGGLAHIAEDGHVISFKRGFENIFKNEGEIIPEEIGVRHASTFMGFCGSHDDRLFAPIEKTAIVADKPSALLLSYRALCYEYFQKETAIRCSDLERQMDKGKPFPLQVKIQQFSHVNRVGLRRGMEELKAWKKDYDKAYLAGDLTDFHFYAALFSMPFPLVACGGFIPEFDLAGKPLQAISRGTHPLETIFLNLTVVGGKSLLVLGYRGNEDGPAGDFIKSFASLPKTMMANTAFHLPLEYLENTYLQPSWWKGRSDAEQAYIIRRARTMTGPGGPGRTPSSLTKLGYQFATATVEQELQG